MTYFMDPMTSRRKPSQHRIYLHFMRRPEGWYCQFLEEDLKTPLPRKLNFATADKLLEMHERWGEARLLEDRSALEYAINTGRGSIWLILSPEQYAKLKTA